MTESFRPGIDTSRFFDWASTAPVSAACATAMDAFSARARRHTSPPDFLTESTRGLALLRDRIRSVFNADVSTEVILVRSVAEASSALARILTLPPGSNVVVSEADHPALVAPWCWLADTEPDVELRTIRCDDAGVLDLDDARLLVDDETAVVTCTQLTHLDGVLQPVRELAALARERSVAAVIVDGAQSVGRVSVDVDDLGADVFVASGRKALLGPFGAGFAIVRPGLLDDCRPFVFSTRNTVTRMDGDGRWQPGPRYLPGAATLEGNLPDLRSLYGLLASLNAYQKAGPARLAQLCTERAETLETLSRAACFRRVKRLPDRPNGIIRLASPRVPDHRRLKAGLAASGFSLAATEDWLRVSVHAFSTDEGITRLCGDLAEAAGNGGGSRA